MSSSRSAKHCCEIQLAGSVLSVMLGLDVPMPRSTPWVCWPQAALVADTWIAKFLY